MKKILFLFSFITGSLISAAQDAGVTISAGLHLPLGTFAETHSLGIGLNAGPSGHKLPISKTKLAFTYHGGGAYYFGKTEIVSGHTFTYPDYTFIHAFAGAIYVPVKKMSLQITAGPALGIYRKDTRFNIGASLGGNYHFNANWSLSPSLWMMKESKSNPIAAASLKLGYSF